MVVVIHGVFRRRILFWMVTSVGLIPGHFLQINMREKSYRLSFIIHCAPSVSGGNS